MTALRHDRLLVLVSARSPASETNATRVQSPLTTTSETVPLDCRPPLRTDTRIVAFEYTSCTNASGLPFVSPGTRLLAAETNATQRGATRDVPSSDGRPDGPLAGWPLIPREASMMLPKRHGVPLSP